MISDYYTDPHRRWIQPVVYPNGPLPNMDDETVKELKKAVTLLDSIDKRLKDIECMDAKKAKFLKDLDDRMKIIENKDRKLNKNKKA